MAEISIDALPRTRKEAIERGFKHYFTGRPCKRGHIKPRVVTGRQCVDCSRNAARMWAIANPDRTREISRAFEARHRTEITARVRSARAIDPDRTRKIGREQYKANRRKRCDQAKARRAANLEKARKRDRDQYADKRDDLLNRYHIRRA